MVNPTDVIVITAHDLGRHLHCYGVDSVVSPNLDRLAEEGTRLTGAFATAPQCSPSRASLATGLYPHTNGVMGLAHPGFDWDLAPGTLHAAAIFAGLGFDTHLFGLQHVTLHPERLGFAHIHASSSDHVHVAAGGRPVASAVENFLSGELSGRPLYMEINIEEAHRPYDSGGLVLDRSAEVTIPAYLPHSPEAKEELRALQGSIKELDTAVGRVLAALARAERAERALIVFTTDHGLAMPRAKCTLYDPGLEITLIARWPTGGIASGALKSELVSNIDVLPTLLQAVEAPMPAAVQGRSFLPLLRNENYQPRPAIFAEKTFHSYYDPMRCVRTRRHKYICNFETGFAVEVPGDVQQGAIFRSDPSRYSTDRPSVVELYDLDNDPAEQDNLAGTLRVDSIERQLNSELWRWMRETGDPLIKGPIASPRNRLAMERSVKNHVAQA